MTRSAALVVALVVCLSAGFATADASAATGDLTQKPGTAGCISNTGAGPCVDGRALDNATSTAVSPDGRHAYVASLGDGGAVAVFDRAADGTLTQKSGTAGCVSSDGFGGCDPGTALSGASSVTVSGDGASVYVASLLDDAVAVFDRASDGTLTQKAGLAGCVSDTGAGPCADGTALAGATSVSVSRDGKSAYVASEGSDAVAVFDRAADGGLTQKPGTAGCVSESGSGGACADGRALTNAKSVTVGPEGTTAYVASAAGGVVVFDRSSDGTLTQKPGTAGCVSEFVVTCATGKALSGATSVAVSPGGKSAYVASFDSDAVAVFDRASDGTLTQKLGTAGCVSETGRSDPNVAGTAGQCVNGTALESPDSVTVSRDGQSVYSAASGSDAVSVFDRAGDGMLTQKPGTAGCISDDGSGGCADGRALDGVQSIAVSPDGRSVYGASYSSSAVAVLDREPASFTLAQKPGTAGCISETGDGGTCADGTALFGAFSVTVSPNGQSAYVASANSDAVLVFDRAADGTLTQKPGTVGCISETGSGGACVDGTALDGPRSVTVSPDGQSVYVASANSDAVAVFDRAADGTLTQKPGTAGCVSETGSGGACADGTALDGAFSVTVAPDGDSAYVASLVGDAVAVFDRAAGGTLTPAGCSSETGAGPCADGTALDGPQSVVVSDDGTNAYVASQGSSAVAVFDRGADGTLTQKTGTAGCISESGSGGACVDGKALVGAASVTVSSDGRSAYVASNTNDGAVAVFDRAPDGTLTQKPGTAGCVSDSGTGGACVDGEALVDAISVVVSADGHSAYVASNVSDAVVVFDRAADGTLTQKPDTEGCISEAGDGICRDGTALDDATSVTVSPDGQNAYVASSASDAVAVFDRTPEAGSPAQPTVSIADASPDPVAELDSGTNEADLVVSLSGSSSQTVTVDYATADGTAVQPGDYVQRGGMLTFAPGDTSETVTVEVNGDTFDEPDEQFTVELSNPDNATAGDASGAVRIQDDDDASTPPPPGDSTPPAASITSGPVGITDDRTPTFRFSSSESGSSFECSIDGGPFSACSSPFTAPPLKGGSHSLRVRARDAAGNQGAPASFSFQISQTLEELNAADPPTLGVDVNVDTVSGVVLVGIRGAAAKRGGARASQKGVTFVPLTQARQIPVGSFLNTRRGTVRMTSARNAAGAIQTGDFGRGLFQVLQSRRRSAKGLTDLVLKGSSFRGCGSPARGRRASAAGARTIRRLRANARGRFRSRGRHSAATVRGTKWETIDRCDGTLTRVSRGSVTVRDFRRKRNVVVRAGKRYLARARR